MGRTFTVCPFVSFTPSLKHFSLAAEAFWGLDVQTVLVDQDVIDWACD